MFRIKNVYSYLIIFFHSLFYGLKGADKKILGKSSNNSSSDVQDEQDIIQDSLYNDYLNGEETERVQENRDSMYRVYKESDTYDVILDKPFFESDNDNEITFNDIKAIKKGKSFFTKRPLILERGKEFILIQDQKIFELDTSEKMEEARGKSIKPSNLITIDYKNFIPKFNLSSFVKKVVVWKDENKYLLDLYVNDSQRHFNMTDALFIREIVNKKEDKSYSSDTLFIDSLSFITDKANNEEDLIKYDFSDLNYSSIINFNGSFVITYISNKLIKDNVVSKYKTKGMDEKYKNKSPKSNTINFEDALNNIKTIN